MKRNQSGFTLIEIAIVLVIIGLLLGGVLKGQELINSAKVKSLATDFRNIPVYIYGYQDKFRAIPGDDRLAASHVSGATTIDPGNGNGLIDGDWNSTTTTDESYNFWQHVRLAGLAPGSTDIADPAGDYIPINSVAGVIGIQSGTTVAADAPIMDNQSTPVAIRGTYIICSSNILGKFAKQLDIQLDDGNTETGAMMSALSTTADPYAVGDSAVATDDINDAGIYVVCMGV
ncbi:MAG: prepilin-type N-terminal cleavage/methylation domain-containing protein [Gammaproteobacteria bacterium]|nr:prepilin-type N-terminal cleavage/methylation domain-containing protein [Gammaproteobacteria bacterium]MBU1776597.1 prepilin-type N-terminal cleavage/methylation domain-containing protein [Gammaproteobacteria bacterium]MBU1968964.1 prepilin-type N-terminal cleavage/methylation domain-containing protein [Gammaproteobacteria bacterium]